MLVVTSSDERAELCQDVIPKDALWITGSGKNGSIKYKDYGPITGLIYALDKGYESVVLIDDDVRYGKDRLNFLKNSNYPCVSIQGVSTFGVYNKYKLLRKYGGVRHDLSLWDKEDFYNYLDKCGELIMDDDLVVSNYLHKIGIDIVNPKRHFDIDFMPYHYPSGGNCILNGEELLKERGIHYFKF